jgi:hypothetical protein
MEFQSGEDVNTAPNLTLYARLFKDEVLFTEIKLPYNKFNSKADGDFSGLDLVEPYAPPDAAISAYQSGVIEGITCKLAIEFNDMFGTPPQIPGVVTYLSRTVIYGHTPYWYGVGPDAKDVILHSYIDSKGNFAVKEIRKDQDEFVYIYSQGGAAVPVYFEIIYTDASSVSTPTSSVAMAEGKVSYVNIGYNAVNLDNIVDPTKTVQSIVAHFNINGSDEIITYALDDHDTVYDEYLLYENGIGGCEVVRCSGRHSINVDTKSDFVQKARGRGSNFKDGFAQKYNATGGEVWEMNTGYYNEQYIRHLGQMFLATKVWYIDKVRQKFVSVTIRNNGANLIDFENDLYAIPFTMKFDDRPSLTTFGI